jgi:general secretion pathway protein A
VQPSAFRSLADPIYEAFYGLTDQPFAITTDPKFFYLSVSHQQAFGELLNGLRRREGMLLLTGETGTGKTTLCRAVLESLGSRTFSAMILNPYMSGAEVFRVVLRDFGLVSPEDLRRGALANADVPQLLDTIETFLRSLVAIDSHAVIVLDEAQSLTPQVLDQIRLLTALEKDNRRLVQVVLCGQPALLETLKTEPLLALNERITRRVTLAPLGSSEVHAYIQHRLAIAGGMHSVTFGPDATRVVADLSRGLPRRINVLCDRALEEGRFEGVTVMTPDIVKRAARSVGLPQLPAIVSGEPEATVESTSAPSLVLGQISEPTSRRPWVLAGVLAAIAAALSVGYGAYAWTTISGLAVPAAQHPAEQSRRAESLAGPLPLPSDDEIRARLTPRIFVAPPAPPSAELPDNPNQLN